MPLFQAIYLKEKNKLLKHIYNDEGLLDSRPQLKPIEIGPGLKSRQSISNPRMQHRPFDAKQTFYGLPSIDYQNYKYRKVPAKLTGNRKLAPQNRLLDIKEPLEHYVQNIQTQKRILSNIQLNDSVRPHEALRREFNRNKSNQQELQFNTEVSMNEREKSERHSMDRIVELEHSNGLESDGKKGAQRIPQSFRIKSERSKSDILEKKDETLTKSVDISQRNNTSIKEKEDDDDNNLQKWKAEFEECCALSKKWFAEYKQNLLKEDGSENGAKLHFLSIALKGLKVKFLSSCF